MARLRLEELDDLAYRALTASRTSEANARCVAASIVSAEASDLHSHGLMRLPTYCRHARSGKVDGLAVPTFSQTAPAVVRIDARNGFAHPAIDVALDRLVALAGLQGVAAASVYNSYNSGVMGDHVERVARHGLVAMAFANAPAVIAPWGGIKPLFGTNPIAFAAPVAGGDPIVIDQASSVVARGEVMLRAQRGDSIPEGWGLDATGHSTTDPHAVLNGGSMLPAGGHKGATLALMVEVLAATLTGSLHSRDAGSLTADDQRHAGVGQFFVALDPGRLSGERFAERLAGLCAEMSRDGRSRLPGSRRYAARKTAHAEGVSVDDALLRQISELQ